MRKERRISKSKLTEKELKVVEDLSIPVDVASFMLGITASLITHYRYRMKIKDSLRKAAKKYRDKLKEAHLEKFGKTHASYNYWSEEEIKYIMTSTDSDLEQAEKLGRTVYSIQKKRERERLKEANNAQINS